VYLQAPPGKTAWNPEKTARNVVAGATYGPVAASKNAA
jgi:hypothetical protein